MITKIFQLFRHKHKLILWFIIITIFSCSSLAVFMFIKTKNYIVFCSILAVMIFVVSAFTKLFVELLRIENSELRRKSKDLTLVLPKLSEYLHENKCTTLYVSKSLYKILPIHNEEYDWYNKKLNKWIKTLIIIDSNLHLLDYSKEPTGGVINNIEDLYE